MAVDSGDDDEEEDGFFVPHGYLSDSEGDHSGDEGSHGQDDQVRERSCSVHTTFLRASLQYAFHTEEGAHWNFPHPPSPPPLTKFNPFQYHGLCNILCTQEFPIITAPPPPNQNFPPPPVSWPVFNITLFTGKVKFQHLWFPKMTFRTEDC